MTADLTLYQSPTCFYCWRVRRALADLGVEIDSRDVGRDPEARAALFAARGRTTVPVLRIAGADGDTWMPESADIIAYLRQRFGGSRS